MILCGGKGTRLRDVSELLPKPMVSIGEFPIVWHIMKTYAAFDIGTCTTVCAYIQDIDGEEADSSVLRTTGGTGLYPSLVAFPKGKKPLV